MYFKDEHSELCESLKYSKMRVRTVKAAKSILNKESPLKLIYRTSLKGKGPCLPLIKMVEQALCLHFCISIYINTAHFLYNIHSHSPSYPRISAPRPIFSSWNHVLRHKTRKIPPQVFAIFLAFSTFAVLSTEKSRKKIQGAKRCLLAPCPFRAIFFLKNNCENIWWLWEKSVILHSLNGTSGTPLTTATAKSSLKEIT